MLTLTLHTMILKITALFCAVTSTVSLLPSTDSYVVSNDLNMEFDNCKVSGSELKEETWYQDGAFLQVNNGTFTVELLTDDSLPKLFYAKEKGITKVKKGFAKVPSLEWMSLANNLIEKIEGSVFEGLPGLVYLSLAHNRITDLNKDSFKGLTRLEVLNLDHNALKYTITFSISNSVLPALTQLHLEHNQLEHIEVDSYSDLRSLLCNSSLRHLYLSNNTLYTVRLDYNENSVCLKNLTHLYLDDNMLNDFGIGKLKLEALSLNGNNFNYIPNVNPELRFLSMTRNRLFVLSNLDRAVNIVRIILSYNNLFNINRIQNFSCLEYLALDHNSISDIPDGFLYNLSSLTNLYLSDNNINQIAPTAFAKLPALQKLDLHRNRLSRFPGQVSFGKSNLTYLDLSFNEVVNVSNLEANMIPKLKVLKLTGNPLKLIGAHSVSSDTNILF